MEQGLLRLLPCLCSIVVIVACTIPLLVPSPLTPVDQRRRPALCNSSHIFPFLLLRRLLVVILAPLQPKDQ